MANNYRPNAEEVKAARRLLDNYKRKVALEASETAGILHIPFRAEVEDPNDPEAGWKGIYFDACRLQSVISCVIAEERFPEEVVASSIALDLKPAKRVLTHKGVALLLAEAERHKAKWRVPADRTEILVSQLPRNGHEELALRLLRIAEFHSIPAEE